ncbi:MAG: SpoIIE family protein phosphatase [Rhizobiales bacterium]|nr:SpoIIE family protein phosphatase [Hyphomicrobiales bacterium]
MSITHFAHASAAIIGARENQEDACGSTVLAADGSDAGAQMLVAVVADGMGGHAAGEEASRTAVEAFLDVMRRSTERDRRFSALEAANAAIMQRTIEEPQFDGMGCTLVSAVIDADGLRWVSVGDSLLYLFRNGRLRRLNADHSMAPVLDDLAERGLMDRLEARHSPRRHHLRSALTGRSMEMIDLPDEPIALEANDCVLLASDGLETLPEGVIEAILRRQQGEGADRVADALLEAVAAAAEPYQDNATVFVVQARGDGECAEIEPTQPLPRRG